MAQTILLKRRTADATAPVSSDLATGEIAVNAYSGKLYVKKTDGTVAEISGSGEGSGLIPSATFVKYEYTATSGQTTFSGNDDNSQSLTYVVGNILVYKQGELLDTSDYTASNGSSIVLGSGATANDIVSIISYNKNIGTGNTTIVTFSGNGSTTAFTLSEDPGDENNTRVFIDGIYQSKSNYSVSGTTLTFSTAPPSGTGIEVEIGNREISTSGITEMTITGDLTVDTNTLFVDSSDNRVGIGTTSPSTTLQVAGTATATAFAGPLTGNVTGNVSGSAGSTTGNAATATALANARTISGTSFDGTANITLNTSGITENTNLYYTDARVASYLSTNSYATQSWTTTQINNLIDSAPGALNTLNELAAALGDDASFSTTMTNSLALKVGITASTGAAGMPVGTTGQRPGSPAAGQFRYNSTLSKFEGYTDSWGEIGGGGGSNTFTTDNFTGNNSTTAFTLSQTVESEDNLIVFEEGIYQNKGDYTLSGTTLTFDEAPASGRKITVFSVKSAISGSNLNQNSFTGNGSTAAYTLSLAPVNENNTQVFLDGVYQHKNTYSVSGTTLTFDTNIPNGTAIEVMTFNQTDINVPVDNTITTAKIVDDAVTADKLASNAVVTASIVDDAVTAAKIASNAVDTANIVDDSVTAAKLASNAVVTASIVDDAVTSDKLASGLTLGGTTTATLASGAQGGITAVGTLTSLTSSGNITANNLSITSTNWFGFGDYGERISGSNANSSLTFYTDATNALHMDSSQRSLYGHTTSQGFVWSSVHPKLQIEGTDASSAAMSITRNSANGSPPYLILAKSRGGSVNSNTIVVDDDVTGEIMFAAADGTNKETRTATIYSAVDGTPGSDDMPGRLVFGTTKDGNAAPTVAMTIDSSQKVGIGTGAPESTLHLKDTSSNAIVQTTWENDARKWRFGVHGGLSDAINLYDETAGASRFTITSGGAVGIGITNPTEKFTVVNSSSGIVGRFTNNTNQTLDLGVIDGSGAAGGVYYNSANSGHHRFQVGTSTKMYISGGGEVGIGNTDPAKPLHISSSDNQPLRVESTDAYTGIELKDSGSATLPPLISALSDDFIFYGGHASTRPALMFMDSSTGNVGIGNTTPQYLLDVSNDANNSLQASFGRTLPSGNWAGIHFGYKETGNTSYRKSALVFERVDGSVDGFTGAARGNNAGGRIHMLLANYGSSTASNLTQFSEDALNGHVVSTYHVGDGSFENIHSAEWTHATTATEANYSRQRQSLVETLYDSQYALLDPPAYSNGNWYLLVGVKSGTQDRSVTFKVDLAQASYIFFEAKSSNSADSQSRTNTIDYSFDNVTYTQLGSEAWTTGQNTQRNTVFFNATSQSNYTGQIYLRAKITGASTSHSDLVGWQGFKIKAMAQSMSFNTNKTFRGASRYIGQFCTDATQNAAIVSADTGSIRFASHMDGSNMDTDIMEARTSGNYGVQFKKSGWVKLDFHQDIQTANASSYLYVYVYRGTASAIDGGTASRVGEFLLTNTDSQWNTINGGCFTRVDTNDVIQCKIVAGNIMAMDSTSWSHWMFDWFEQKTL